MSKPDFSHELNLWNRGLKAVAGCDEVGRGCLAGPVVASVVIFENSKNYPDGIKVKIDDSKKLSEKQRETSDKWIRKNALAFGIGEVGVTQINKLGIVMSTQKAMRIAIKNSQLKIDHLLSDAFYIPRIKGIGKRNQTPIVKGDSLSLSIASASIIAKVYRDKLMIGLSQNKNLKKYGWMNNKGYGTKEHITAILKHGVTKHHRTLFVRSILSKP